MVIAAAVGLAILGLGWHYRQAGAHDATQARLLIARALREGHRAALDGRQRVEVTGTAAVHAHLVQSSDGKVRIDYMDGANKGRTIWDNGTLVWRWTPSRKRMTIARCRRGSDVLDPRREALILKNFEPQLAGTDQIAGRPAHI